MADQIIIGIHPVIQAVETGKSIDRVYIQKNANSSLILKLKNKLKEHNVNYNSVPIQKLNRISRKNHQGVCAFISPIEFYEIENLLPTIYEKGETPFLLILDRITDTRNFGAIIRSAECSGIHAILVSNKNSAPVNDVVAKTSAGAIFSIPICKESNLKDSLQYLKDSGIRLIASSDKAMHPVYSEDWTLPTGLIMGSEESGISKTFFKMSDSSVFIPMRGNTKSLNVSVATGTILFEAVRQKFYKAFSAI